MTPPAFLPVTSLADLGRGSGLAVWSFRACAVGRAGCCTLVRGYENVFGKDGPPALGSMLSLARLIGHDGKRKVSLALPGCIRITRDELSLLTALAASQVHDEALRDAHLSWLTASAATGRIGALTDHIAGVFSRHNLQIVLPAATAPAVPARPGKIYAIESGHA